MEKAIKKEALNRMNYLIGHLRAVKNMIEKEEYCIDIIHQNTAVCEAIKKVSGLILKNYLDTCFTQAMNGKNKRERKNKYKELLGIYRKQNE